jgi:hypothetical protein
MFASEDASGVVSQLHKLGDPRIWHIGSDMLSSRQAHYFDAFVERFLPELPSMRIETAVDKVLKGLVAKESLGGANTSGD